MNQSNDQEAALPFSQGCDDKSDLPLKNTEVFRQRYRDKIHPRYSGVLHVLSVFILGCAFILFCLTQVESVTFVEWLVIPLALVIFNMGEYVTHKHFGHKKIRWMKLFYQRHSGDHHTFFVDNLMTVDSTRDWRVVFFPVYLVIVVSVLIAAPFGYLMSLLISDNAGWLFAGFIVFGYLHYEVSHYVWHLPENHWLFNIRFLASMRSLHQLHHHMDLRHKYNFNITWPLMDLLMKTYRPKL